MKQVYVKPILKNHGNLKSITMGGGSSNSDGQQPALSPPS